MKVLVACEYSGTVRDAFRKLGHDAYSCDIIPCDLDNTYHYQCDVFEVLNYGWDLLIAHPPCTYLSNAGAKHLYRGKKLNIDRYNKGIAAKEFFMKLYNSDIEKICIENPLPSTIFGLPKESQIIEPYYFGDPYKKRTHLWLKNLPLLQSTSLLRNGENTRLVGNWFNSGGKDRQKNRAKTFQGIADAMAAQWSNPEFIQLSLVI